MNHQVDQAPRRRLVFVWSRHVIDQQLGEAFLCEDPQASVALERRGQD